MTTTHKTAHARRLRIKIAAATMLVATAAVGAGPLGQAVAHADYSNKDFEDCMNRNMPTDYCCEHAGGVMRGGACIDPATLRVGPVQTQPTRRPLPGVAPPATAVNRG